MIKITSNFINILVELRGVYFPNEDHGRTENKKYWKTTQAIENFNNGCLTYDRLISILSKSLGEEISKVHEIVSGYIDSFGDYEYKIPNSKLT